MDITILPLTPKLADDYFDFFENRAFTDDSPYRCYCQVFQMSKAEYDEAYNSISDPNEIGRASRKIAKQQIDAGILRGYLAFAEDVYKRQVYELVGFAGVAAQHTQLHFGAFGAAKLLHNL